MNGRKLYEAFGNIADDIIEDADVTLHQPEKRAAGRERTPSAFARFMNTPAAAAVISAVVAFAVLFFIVRAGQGRPVTPDPGPAGHPTAQSETQAPAAETEAASETQTSRVPTQIDGEAQARLDRIRTRTNVVTALSAVLLVLLTGGAVCAALYVGRGRKPLPRTEARLLPSILLTAAVLLLLVPGMRFGAEVSDLFLRSVSVFSFRVEPQINGMGIIGGTNPSAVLSIALSYWLLAAHYLCGFAVGMTACVLAWRNRLSDRRGTLLAGVAGACAVLSMAFMQRFNVSGSGLFAQAQVVPSAWEQAASTLVPLASAVCALTAALIYLSCVTKPLCLREPVTIGAERRRWYIVCPVLTGIGAAGMLLKSAAETVTLVEKILLMKDHVSTAVQTAVRMEFGSLLTAVLYAAVPLVYIGLLYRKNKAPALPAVIFAAAAVWRWYDLTGSILSIFTNFSALPILHRIIGETVVMQYAMTDLVKTLTMCVGCIICAVEAARGWKHPRRLWWFWGARLASSLMTLVLMLLNPELYGTSVEKLFPLALLFVCNLCMAVGTTLFVCRFPQPSLTQEEQPRGDAEGQ